MTHFAGHELIEPLGTDVATGPFLAHPPRRADAVGDSAAAHWYQAAQGCRRAAKTVPFPGGFRAPHPRFHIAGCGPNLAQFLDQALESGQSLRHG